jgi:hypothetical protein
MSKRAKTVKHESEVPEIKETGMNLTFFLGQTETEQARTLGMIQNTCGDILVQNQAEDCAFHPETIRLITQLYMVSNSVLRQIAA